MKFQKKDENNANSKKEGTKRLRLETFCFYSEFIFRRGRAGWSSGIGLSGFGKTFGILDFVSQIGLGGRHKSLVIHCLDMTTVDLVMRRWGNSLAALFPKSVVDAENLKPKDVVRASIVKFKPMPKGAFGMFKGLGLSGDEVKRISREELQGEFG